MALGGALFEIESIKALSDGGADRLVGHGMVVGPAERAGGGEVRRPISAPRPSKTPTARHWFGYVSLHAVRLGAEKAKSLEGPKMAEALEDLELPPEVALQPGKIRYRAGDHELMTNIFVGEVHPPEGGPGRRVQGRGRWCRASRPPARSKTPAARWSHPA